MYNSKEGKKCVTYIRVSSERQVKGFSLDGQKRYLKEWAERQGMTVLDDYVEEGKSGKSIDGRDKFQRLLEDIKTGKYDVDYIIVYKLSRFGRNAKDILTSLEFIQKHGVELLSVEDGVDSSNAMGKLMITVLSAVVEMERENIITQSLLGREEKAKKGGWNGGFLPYGYKKNEKGEIVIDESRSEPVRIIFQKYLYENMGYNGITKYLNTHGYKREKTKNSKRKYDTWTTDQVKKILDNPIYCGKIAWGRRRTTKMEGTNEYKHIQQKEFVLSNEASHEGYITEEEYKQVQARREIDKKKGNRNFNRENAHLLSGILKCPDCGAPMYINYNRWKNKDGEERETKTYICSHYMKAKGTKDCKRNGITAKEVEKEVVEYTSKLMHNPRFAKDIQERISTQIDKTALKNELKALEDKLLAHEKAKLGLEKDIDNISLDDRAAERKRQDYNKRLEGLYEEIIKVEDEMATCERKIEAVEQSIINMQSIYNMLYNFEKLYAKMNDIEKRLLISSLIKEVKVYSKEERKKEMHWLKEVVYKFPIDKEFLEFPCKSETSVETVVHLVRQNVKIL